jgi:hypothetical protein
LTGIECDGGPLRFGVVQRVRLLEIKGLAVCLGFQPDRRPQRAMLLAVDRRAGELFLEAFDPLESGVRLVVQSVTRPPLHENQSTDLQRMTLFNRALPGISSSRTLRQHLPVWMAGALMSMEDGGRVERAERNCGAFPAVDLRNAVRVCRTAQITITSAANLVGTSGPGLARSETPPGHRDEIWIFAPPSGLPILRSRIVWVARSCERARLYRCPRARGESVEGVSSARPVHRHGPSQDVGRSGQRRRHVAPAHAGPVDSPSDSALAMGPS